MTDSVRSETATIVESGQPATLADRPSDPDHHSVGPVSLDPVPAESKRGIPQGPVKWAHLDATPRCRIEVRR